MTKTGFFRKLFVIVAACALALALSGCGGMTLDKLMIKMDTALEGKETYELSAAMELDATLNFDDEIQEISADLEMDLQSSLEHNAFIDMEIDADVAGERMNETLQVYVVDEEEAMATYIHVDSEDSWNKTDAGMTYDELFASNKTENSTTSLFSEIPADLALADETEIVENREAYVLTCTFTGSDLINNTVNSDSMSEAEKALAGYDIDLSQFDTEISALDIPATIYVDAETFMPVRVEFEVQGISEIINSLIDSIVESIANSVDALENEIATGIYTADMDISVEITMAKLIINNLGFEPVEVPDVPAEGVAAAEQQMLAASGTYILEYEGNAAKIVAPEGWSAADYSSDYVYLVSDDYTKQVSCEIYTDMTSEDFIYNIEELYVPAYIDMDYYVAHGAGSKINGFETMYIECPDDTMLYFAGAPIGDNGWLWIEMSDSTGDDMESALTPVIEAVEEYQL